MASRLAEIVKQGSFLYDGLAHCDIKIIHTDFRPGCDDDEAPVEDAYGDFYEVRYSWPNQSSRAGGGYFDTVGEAVAAVESKIKDVIWE